MYHLGDTCESWTAMSEIFWAFVSDMTSLRYLWILNIDISSRRYLQTLSSDVASLQCLWTID